MPHAMINKEESAFVRVFKENGYNVLFSHIETGQDFFEYEPIEKYDLVISNPPYSLRTPIMQRLYFNIKKPFALLINESGLFDTKYRYEMLKTNQFELMIFDKRVHYEKDGIVKKQEPFKSIYLCSNLLPDKIVFEVL
jgi:hypothetical protein